MASNTGYHLILPLQPWAHALIRAWGTAYYLNSEAMFGMQAPTW